MSPETNGYSLEFNGSNQRARNLSATGIFGLSAMTLESWFEADTVAAALQSIIGVGNRAGPGEVVANLRMSTSKLAGYIGAGGSDTPTTGATTLSSGVWYHGALVYDGVDIRVYLGTQTTPDALDNTPQAKTGLMNTGNGGYYLGAYGFDSPSAYGDYFFGRIDEARVWNYARTLAQLEADKFRRLSGDETGLIGLHRCNEGSGATTADSSPTGNNLTLDNSPTWSTDVPFPGYQSENNVISFL